MKNIPFNKYTTTGNNFVIVDEIDQKYLTEREKSNFAYHATNMQFGVGCDNFLMIEPYNKEIIKSINEYNQYWKDISEVPSADYVFRMFEPDGVEAYCCANGLMCIAHHLKSKYNIISARILTEVPTQNPRVIKIGHDTKSTQSWIGLGHPRNIPPAIANGEYIQTFHSDIKIVKDIEITFREHDLNPFSLEKSLKISAYLVFTGEPHMVIFTDHGWSINNISQLIFVSSNKNINELKKVERRKSFGTWLIKHIGNTINRKYKEVFPYGINVNFVQHNDRKKELEFRCFERGVYKETFSCGTGAVASAYVAKKLGYVKDTEIRILPHRCRWDQTEAQMVVKEKQDGWMLYSYPSKLLDGEFFYKSH